MLRATLFCLILFGAKLAVASDLEALINKAEAGDADAQFQLVTVFGQGLGAQKNFEKAKYWLEKAAESGSAEAQYWTGYKYFYGQGVQRNRAKALDWYEKSARQSYSKSQFMVGYIYQMGHLVDKNLQGNLKKSIYWYELAAQQKEIGALFHLGCFKYFGIGAPVNQKDGEMLILKASSKGQKGAQLFIEGKEKLSAKRLQEMCEIYPGMYS